MIGGRALPTKSVAKPWGRDHLPPPFPAGGTEPIGEIWFEPPGELPELLIKYLFTSEKLSVQVHPSDAQAPAGARGKDECWLIVGADPGARLAVGLIEPVPAEQLRAAAIDGSIEGLLDWRRVEPGDFVYLPAGTVHAIGGGLSLIEVQQNSDVTYRLYDYGRPRELHLDEAVSIADRTPLAERFRSRVADRGTTTLVEGPHFRLDRIDGASDGATMARYGDRPVLALPLDEPLFVGSERIAPGGCGLAGSLAEVRLPPRGRALVAQPLVATRA